MPNSDTFSISPIYILINRYIKRDLRIVDPFVRNSPFKKLCISNDLDPSIEADYHMDALDFLKTIESCSVDLLLFDPPYSSRQVSECYKKMGMSVNMETTQGSFWANLKKEISRIVKTDGVVISFGWNSGGIGMNNNFDIIEILLVPHGGAHYDTICTVEVKSSSVIPMF